MEKILSAGYGVFWIASLVAIYHYGKFELASTVLLLIPGVTVVLLCFGGKNRDVVNKYSGKGIQGFLILIALYYSFALMGRTLFLSEARMNLGVVRILSWLVIAVALYPTSYAVALINRWLGKRISKNDRAGKREAILTGVLSFAIVFIIESIISLCFYPCSTTPDSIDHWKQAMGQTALTDYHPPIFHLFLRLLVDLFNSKTPYPYVLSQIILFSITVGECTFFLQRRIKRLWLLLGAFVVAICPTHYMLLMYLSKNPLTGILNLAVTLSLIEVIVLPDVYIHSVAWQIKTILMTASLYLVRENNVVIIIPLLAFLIWSLISNWKSNRGLLITAFGIVGVVFLIKGPLYSTLDYTHVEKQHETVRPLMAPVASALQQDIELPEDVLEVAERILPIEEWKARYNSFNSDPLTWGTPKPQYAAVTIPEALRVYFKMLGLYPSVVLKDRLDGADIVWDIGPNDGIRYSRYPIGIIYDVDFKDAKLVTESNGALYDIVLTLKKGMTKLASTTTQYKITDIFLWRCGIYTVLCFMGIAYFIAEHKSKMLWAIAPSVSILFTYLLVIAWQMYFYLWFFPLATVMFLMSGIYVEDMQK